MTDIAEMKTKRDALVAEMKTVNDRLASKDAPASLKERGANLLAGIARLEAAIDAGDAEWKADMLARYERGELYGENGHDSGPVSPGYGGASSVQVGQFAKSLMGAGFNLKSRPSVTVSLADALKAPTWPASTDWNRADPVIVPRGMDRRFLWPALQQERLGTSTMSIQDFRQTARTLTGTVKRNVDATTDKATLDTTVTLVNESLSQFAVVIEGVPNAILESVRSFSAFLESEGQFQVMKAIDEHVLAPIVAAAPPFGTTGTTTIDKVRNGIATMRGTGTNPNLVVLNPTDSAALDLSADAGGYVFPTSTTGTSSPLWGLNVVERIGAGTEPPYLIDTNSLGVLYLGSMRFDAEPYTAFKKNLTTLRVEVNALFHVRNAEGARRIAAT